MYDCIIVGGGPAPFNADERRKLETLGIGMREECVRGLCGKNGNLECIEFVDGTALQRDALFFSTGQHQHSHLPARLGCDFTEQDCVPVGKHQVTNQPGMYVASDASVDVQLVIVAAAEGTKAAIDINESLTEEDLEHGSASLQGEENDAAQGDTVHAPHGEAVLPVDQTHEQ